MNPLNKTQAIVPGPGMYPVKEKKQDISFSFGKRVEDIFHPSRRKIPGPG